jgi:hypothetical protein
MRYGLPTAANVDQRGLIALRNSQLPAIWREGDGVRGLARQEFPRLRRAQIINLHAIASAHGEAVSVRREGKIVRSLGRQTTELAAKRSVVHIPQPDRGDIRKGARSDDHLTRRGDGRERAERAARRNSPEFLAASHIPEKEASVTERYQYGALPICCQGVPSGPGFNGWLWLEIKRFKPACQQIICLPSSSERWTPLS